MAQGSGEPYTGQSKGWVVRSVYVNRHTHKPGVKHGHKATGEHEHVITTYWYGPDHGWGTTSGPLDYSAQVYKTKFDAEWALRSVYGVPSEWKRRRYEAVRLDKLERQS